MCGDDGEQTRHERQTSCQKLLIRLQALIFFCLALYTIFSLFKALEQVTRTDLQLSDTPPSDRCVPFFDTVKAFKEDTKTFALYDYRNGDAIVRLCSNETSANIRSKIGASFAYDPWKADTGCDVLGTDQSAFLANCETADFQTGDPSTCQGILDIYPKPYGAHWNMYAQRLTGNKTYSNGTVAPYPYCSIKVTRIPSIAACTYQTVEPMHELNENAAALIKFGVAVPFIVMVLQGIACFQYSKTWAADDGWMLAFACRGVPGSLYMLYWVCKEGDEGRGEFPDTFFNFWGWLACAVQDALEGLAVPLVAILGCRVDRYPLNLTLVILKGLKFVFDFVMYVKNRNEESEPGGQAEQERLWASNPPEESEQNKHLQQMNNMAQHQPQMQQGGYPQQGGFAQQQPGFPQPQGMPTNQV